MLLNWKFPNPGILQTIKFSPEPTYLYLYRNKNNFFLSKIDEVAGCLICRHRKIYFNFLYYTSERGRAVTSLISMEMSNIIFKIFKELKTW